MEIHAIDLSQFMVKWRKYRREMKANPPAELPWLMMLTAADYRKKRMDEEIFHELEEFSLNEQEIREALIEWENLSSNKENKVLYEARLKFLRDQLSNMRGERQAGKEEGIREGIKKGIKEGRKEGLEKGIKQGMKQLILNMAEKGLTVDEIVNLTGLKEDEVRDLLR